MIKMNWLLLLILILFISGCNINSNTNQDLVFTRIDNITLKANVQEWVERNSINNGIYLYQENEETFYIYFNNYNVVQGDVASYYKDVKAETVGDKIVISFSVLTTGDYTDAELENNRLLYKLILLGKFETIQLLENNRETHFNEIKVGGK